MARCPKCQAAERVAGQAWCRGCLSDYQRARRAKLRGRPAKPKPAGCRVCATARAEVEAAFAAHVAEVRDPGLLARVQIGKLKAMVLAAL